MDELSKKMTELGGALEVGWSSERAQRALKNLPKRQRRQKLMRASSAAAIFALAGLGAWMASGLFGDHLATEGEVVQYAGAGQGSWHFGESSSVSGLSADAQLVLLRQSAGQVELRLERGRGGFKLDPEGETSFQVSTSDLVVRSSDGDFEVSREGDRVQIRVHVGSVAVDHKKGRETVHAGAQVWFGRDGPESSATDANPEPDRLIAEASSAAAAGESTREPSEGAASDGAPPSSSARGAGRGLKKSEARGNRAGVEAAAKNERTRDPQREDVTGEAAPADKDWKKLADKGQYKEAYEVMPKSPKAVRDIPRELVQAANVMRLSGHPGRAVPFLKQLIDNHPGDPEVPQAAFMLGNVYLRMGKASAAANLYAKAQRGPIAEFALAREVESWVRAGNKAKAKQAAARYLKRYPKGPRAERVKKLTGQD